MPPASRPQTRPLRFAFVPAAFFLFFLATAFPPAAFAFPPYESTDADTPDPWTLESRLGFAKFMRDKGENSYSSPLWRVNLGLPRRLELVSEFVYQADSKMLGDAVAGLKWVPFSGESWAAGIEALAFLPVSESVGSGTQNTLILTVLKDNLLLHINAGGFTDMRPLTMGSGWQTSALAEISMGRFRPGLELLAKQIGSAPAQVSLDPGLIVDCGKFDVRLGVRLGLTEAAPDLSSELWISFKLPLR